ncbi:unnamed protein product [Orchesella dallaii]|uniref:C2H2-type domain-containing protein n=1 Tax=Orchesella dallaii TaxID=48710 RepID=A0ABP1PYE1_9HEXA
MGTLEVKEKVKSTTKKGIAEDKDALAPDSIALTEAQKIAAEMKLERKRAAIKKLKETLKTLVRDKDEKLPKGRRRKRPRKEQYSCEECSFQCSSTPKMEQHLREHETPEKTLKCPDCNKEFSQKQYWDFHIYVYCGATTWKCDICYEALHGGKLREHYENFHDGKVYTCEFCDYCFGTYQAYLNHASKNHPHTEISFHCTFCPPENSLKVYTRIDLLRHLHEAHNQTDNAFVCDYPNCSKVYYNVSSMSFHRQTHDPILPSCNICGKTYALKIDVEAHIKYVHKKEGPYKCDMCAEVFISTTTLVSHKRHKHGLDKLKCELCPDKEYRSSRGLTIHMMATHGIGIKNKFACETCGKEFLSQANLERHKPVHLETKNFTCEICGFATKSLDWLKKHKLNRHDVVKRHACPHCPKKFHLPAHLKEHIRTHTKEKPFQCEACGQAFSQRGSLLLHKKKKHLYQVGRTNTADFCKNSKQFAPTEAAGGGASASYSHSDVKSSTTPMLSESEDVKFNVSPTF